MRADPGVKWLQNCEKDVEKSGEGEATGLISPLCIVQCSKHKCTLHISAYQSYHTLTFHSEQCSCITLSEMWNNSGVPANAKNVF